MEPMPKGKELRFRVVMDQILMIEPARFALFVGVSWALILAPGPDMLYVITRGMAHGRRAALAFLMVKYLGAIYLIYLGIKAWQDKSAFNLQTSSAGANPRALFWQGVMSNVLNPKIAVFFLAFLPQFVAQGNGQIAQQMTILGLTFALFGLCFLFLVGYFAGSAGVWISRQPRFTKFFRWLSGGILLSLGVRLALTSPR